MLMSRNTRLTSRRRWRRRWRRARLAVEPRPHLPQLREEALLHVALQVPRAEGAPGPAGDRSDDPLDELHVQEAPLGELLLVLEQPFGEQEERGGRGAGVQRLERLPLGGEQRL